MRALFTGSILASDLDFQMLLFVLGQNLFAERLFEKTLYPHKNSLFFGQLSGLSRRIILH
jgi:hypothetical protein